MAQIGIEWHRFCCIDTPSCTADIRVKMSHILEVISITWLFLVSWVAETRDLILGILRDKDFEGTLIVVSHVIEGMDFLNRVIEI